MLEFHPSLAIANRLPDGLRHAYWVSCAFILIILLVFQNLREKLCSVFSKTTFISTGFNLKMWFIKEFFLVMGGSHCRDKIMITCWEVQFHNAFFVYAAKHSNQSFHRFVKKIVVGFETSRCSAIIFQYSVSSVVMYHYQRNCIMFTSLRLSLNPYNWRETCWRPPSKNGNNCLHWVTLIAPRFRKMYVFVCHITSSM